MKKILFLLPVVIACLISGSCQKEEEKIEWEYKIIKEDGSALTDYNNNMFFTNNIEETLNTYGKLGWELVTSYTSLETVYPNFGKEEYHTGIKTNTRTASVYFVLKKKVIKEGGKSN